MGQVIDFDAFRREKEAASTTAKPEPVLFKIGGKSYPLPSELPAAVALDIIRLRRVQGDEGMASLSALVGIGEAIFGADTFTDILRENRLGVLELGDLIAQAFAAWPVAEEDAVPNPKTPKGPKRSI